MTDPDEPPRWSEEEIARYSAMIRRRMGCCIVIPDDEAGDGEGEDTTDR